MTMQARDPTELLASGTGNTSGKENASTSANRQSAAALRAKRRSSLEAARRVYDSDRFKLVQSRRGSGAASPGPTTPSNQDEHANMARPSEAVQLPAAAKKKKEPTPQPIVPDQILEAHLDVHGFVKTRTYLKGKFLGKVGLKRLKEALGVSWC
jgi:hypothetical protein